MKNFKYIIKDPVGLHARPAGNLAKKVKEYESKVIIKKGEKAAEAQKLMTVMGLCVKQNDEITIEIDGVDEDRAYLEIQKFFEENF
ncbi:HPr family phosphocarrier protein [Anaerocolumna xylanovorans]|uniref:Phosphocarrier protein n=1 Tax=Anaerocolumna xylanovorans DSM 12503 TaxID=1121345 RepID=A0A1M7Y0U7_9FIRM|nr:HPr family phosphocarrier protein [Anaerocolumna xylanovorans]SHO45258.1 phosphocarrier protein [Anaerocolumna xylanovorans DSM 12503]